MVLVGDGSKSKLNLQYKCLKEYRVRFGLVDLVNMNFKSLVKVHPMCLDDFKPMNLNFFSFHFQLLLDFKFLGSWNHLKLIP